MKQYPDGKIDPTDQGACAVLVTVRKKTVIMNFMKSVSWIGFDPAVAREIANVLLTAADKAEKERENAH